MKKGLRIIDQRDGQTYVFLERIGEEKPAEIVTLQCSGVLFTEEMKTMWPVEDTTADYGILLLWDQGSLT